jgi:acyl carrier protein
VPAEFIHHDALFSSELVDLPFWDSLDAVGIALVLEEELGIELSDEQLERVRNPEHLQQNLKVSDFVADVLAVITAQPRSN